MESEDISYQFAYRIYHFSGWEPVQKPGRPLARDVSRGKAGAGSGSCLSWLVHLQHCGRGRPLVVLSPSQAEVMYHSRIGGLYNA
jgi:hypothetical protein